MEHMKCTRALKKYNRESYIQIYWRVQQVHNIEIGGSGALAEFNDCSTVYETNKGD